MTQLAKFLSSRLGDYGKQREFARHIGCSPGTVNKWLTGENAPNFEGCLKIAGFFKIEPESVFRLAGKKEYFDLYERHIANRNGGHGELHDRLARLLERGLRGEVATVLDWLEARAEAAGEDGDRAAGSDARSPMGSLAAKVQHLE